MTTVDQPTDTRLAELIEEARAAAPGPEFAAVLEKCPTKDRHHIWTAKGLEPPAFPAPDVACPAWCQVPEGHGWQWGAGEWWIGHERPIGTVELPHDPTPADYEYTPLRPIDVVIGQYEFVTQENDGSLRHRVDGPYVEANNHEGEPLRGTAAAELGALLVEAATVLQRIRAEVSR